VKILVVDDHLVVREGIVRLLTSAFPGVDLETAADVDAALRAYGKDHVDLVILDINLGSGNGFSLLKDLFARNERVRVLVFSMHSETGYVLRALHLGARAYVSKSAPADELIAAIRAVMASSRYVESRIAADLAEGADVLETPQLTEREADILRQLGQGKSVRDIAAESGRSYKTISNSCGTIKAKLGLRRSLDLVRVSMGADDGKLFPKE
jgi:two-component system invasion response regulator UvrY